MTHPCHSVSDTAWAREARMSHRQCPAQHAMSACVVCGASLRRGHECVCVCGVCVCMCVRARVCVRAWVCSVHASVCIHSIIVYQTLHGDVHHTRPTENGVCHVCADLLRERGLWVVDGQVRQSACMGVPVLCVCSKAKPSINLHVLPRTLAALSVRPCSSIRCTSPPCCTIHSGNGPDTAAALHTMPLGRCNVGCQQTALAWSPSCCLQPEA